VKPLENVRGADVRFATMPDPRPSLERRIVVIAPPELARLAASGDIAVLDALVDLLNDRERAWAAEVALAAMTRHDELVVAAYSTTPDEWLETLGPTAHTQWKQWLDEHRHRLSWDAERRVFVSPLG